MARLTEAKVAEQIGKLRGNLAAVARAFGVARQSVASYVDRRPALQVALREAREEMKDNAESSLYRAVIEGEAWAVCFYLKTQAKDRGYVEKVEVDSFERRHVIVVRRVVTRRDDGGGTPPGPG
jgi:hypothetical protein